MSWTRDSTSTEKWSLEKFSENCLDSTGYSTAAATSPTNAICLSERVLIRPCTALVTTTAKATGRKAMAAARVWARNSGMRQTGTRARDASLSRSSRTLNPTPRNSKPSAPMVAPMKTGWTMVPKGRPRLPSLITRSPSSVGTPRKERPSTPPVFHCRTTTTNSTTAKMPRPVNNRSTWV